MNRSLNIGVLGCGKLGSAILQGLLASEGRNTANQQPITRITASVRSDATADLLRTKLETARATAFAVATRTELPELQVLQADNGRVVKQSDVIILGCKPYDFEKALQSPDVRDALLDTAERKVLVSILGGVSTNQLWECIQAGTIERKNTNLQIVRVIPNVAARLRQSMTVIGLHETKSGHERTSTHEELASLFSRIGAIEYLPEPLMDNGASLCTSSTAIFAELIGAVAQSEGARAIDAHGGNLHNDALRMAAYAARGAADLILSGRSPAEIVTEVATPGGATRKGLDKLEETGALKLVSDAMAEIFKAAGALGVKEKL